jgi:uncharacterized membrane protein
MSEPTPPTPPTGPPSAPPPGPPPQGGGTGGASPPPSGGGASSNRNLMIILAYLGPLALIPFLDKSQDQEVQWHAKHGLVLLAAEVAFCLVLSILTTASGGVLGCVLVPVFALAVVAMLVVHIVAIVQGTSGKRLEIPWLSQWADRF